MNSGFQAGLANAFIYQAILLALGAVLITGFFFKERFIFIYMHVYAYFSLRDQKVVLDFFGAIVPGSCDLPDLGAGI